MTNENAFPQMTTIYGGDNYEDGIMMTEEQRLNSRLGINDEKTKLVSARHS
jgi:hypothetical protein